MTPFAKAFGMSTNPGQSRSQYIITGQRRIVAVSPSHPGSNHDLIIGREGPHLPGRPRVYAASAYQGYNVRHLNLDIPYKKPEGGELNDEEKEYNRGLSSFRIGIEHRIGRTRRSRILSDAIAIPAAATTRKPPSSPVWSTSRPGSRRSE